MLELLYFVLLSELVNAGLWVAAHDRSKRNFCKFYFWGNVFFQSQVVSDPLEGVSNLYVLLICIDTKIRFFHILRFFSIFSNFFLFFIVDSN